MTKFSKILLRAVGRLPSKQEVFEIVLKEINSPLTGLKPVRNGYYAFMEKEEYIDRLLTDKAKQALGSIGLETRVPPKIRCQRSLICRQIDSYVGSHTSEELLREINDKNRNKAVEIVKFKDYTHLFKVEFQTTEMALAAKMNGLLCFHTRITPDQMEPERYTDVLMCFTCYQLDEHITAKCPTPDKIICSECTGDHSFNQCNSENKKCLNCGGPHRTMAMSCPKKKEAIRRKREEEDRQKQEKEELPLSKIVQRTAAIIGQKTEEKVMGTVVGDIGLRALVMVMDAHVHNIIAPGSYNSRLNKTLKENNIMPINLPNEKIDSCNLIHTNIISEQLKKHYNLDQQEFSPKRKKSRVADQEKEINQEVEEEEMSEQEIPELEEITEDEAILDMHLNRTNTTADASLYEIKIVTKDNTITKLNPQQMRNLYQQGKIKFTRTVKTKITNKVAEELIDRGKMECGEDSVYVVGGAKFKGIRNGQQFEKITK